MRLCVSYLLTDWLCYCHLYSEWSLKTSAQRIKKATTFHRGRRLKCIVCTCPPHPVTEIRRYTVGVMKSSLEMECRHVITADHTRSVGNCRLTLSHCKQHVISAETLCRYYWLSGMTNCFMPSTVDTLFTTQLLSVSVVWPDSIVHVVPVIVMFCFYALFTRATLC